MLQFRPVKTSAHPTIVEVTKYIPSGSPNLYFSDMELKMVERLVINWSSSPGKQDDYYLVPSDYYKDQGNTFSFLVRTGTRFKRRAIAPPIPTSSRYKGD